MQILEQRKELLQALGQKEQIPSNLDHMSLPAKNSQPLEKDLGLKYKSMFTEKQEPQETLANLTMFSGTSASQSNVNFEKIDRLRFFEKKFAPEFDKERELKRKAEQTLDKLDYFSTLDDNTSSKTHIPRQVDFNFPGMAVQSSKSLRDRTERNQKFRHGGKQVLGMKDDRDGLIRKWEQMNDPRKVETGSESIMKRVDMAYERILKREKLNF